MADLVSSMPPAPGLDIVDQLEDPRQDPAFDPSDPDPQRLAELEALNEAAIAAAREVLYSANPEPELEGREAGPAVGHADTSPVGPHVEPLGIDAADLLGLDLPPLRWIVPGIIPEGTFVIASPPKVGKSCLVYQAVVEVAVGGELLGRRVAPGSALYLALEDGRRRGQERLRAALHGRTMPRGRLEMRWSAKRIGQGLEDEIERWLDHHADAALVAIDTLGRVRPHSTGKRNAYEVDVEDLGRLQSLFRDRPIALGIVHHSKKDAVDDFLASVSGTYGITGSVDTIIVMKRLRLEQFGTIVVTGREVAEAEVAVRFDGMTWSEAPAALPEASFERAEVFRIIEESGPIFPAAVARMLGVERSNVAHMVEGLTKTGAVMRTAKGYAVVDRAHEPSHARAYMSPLTALTQESEQSDGGHTRVRAREALVACSDYVAHQSSHRQVGPGVWVCDRCEASA
jgi:hypothetical protein